MIQHTSYVTTRRNCALHNTTRYDLCNYESALEPLIALSDVTRLVSCLPIVYCRTTSVLQADSIFDDIFIDYLVTLLFVIIVRTFRDIISLVSHLI